ncbi:glycerol kinase GlpK [Terrabacter sp. NPDC000476]|uniref:glycerol kinase GlpK n=1 Tax=Terrabacter sp. NPDC000476 TaxID=3154258 RepID=UPI003323ED03
MVTAPTPADSGRGRFVAAVDQGTTSTRCLVLDERAVVRGSAQLEHAQHYPQPGWVEHDPLEIWDNTLTVVGRALAAAGVEARDLVACGVANQRETAVVWERETGRPVHDAIVWQDTRTEARCRRLAPTAGAVERWRDVTGLPPSTYFAGPKIAWILDHVDGARERAEAGELLAGTVDSWLVWNLTGGADGGMHVTDVTNASRTLLMDLRSLAWSPELAEQVGVPLRVLPEIRSSAEVYGLGHRAGPLAGVPVAAALGDQHAALVGQACFEPGSSKCTYGTGGFLLTNTGDRPVRSRHGLLTTVAYRLGAEPPTYALEGSVAVAGSLIHWLRDRLELVRDVGEVESLAGSVEDSGGAYFVPAFSGLYAPRWRPDARGTITGLTAYTGRAHLVRAALEATCFQTREVADAMASDTRADDVSGSGPGLRELRVDGGMVANSLLMQLQADTLQVPVVAPEVVETTAVGAAFAAGLAVGLWRDRDELRQLWRTGRRWEPRADSDLPTTRWREWHRAVDRSLGWVATEQHPAAADDTAAPTVDDLTKESV